MKKEVVFLSVLFVSLVLGSIIFAFSNSRDDEKYKGLDPIAKYDGYAIYDLVEQKGLMCAEMIEVLGTVDGHDYYLSCLKGSNILFIKDDIKLNIYDVLEDNLISLEKLYELNIIDKMDVIYE